MPTITIALITLGLILLFGGPAVARLALRGRDSVALGRVLQTGGIILVVVALLSWPRSPESTAFPPPPEGPPGAPR